MTRTAARASTPTGVSTLPNAGGRSDKALLSVGRSHQLRILGNGVVPQQAAYALTLLREQL